MKKYFTILFALKLSLTVVAQNVGVGTVIPHTSAQLEIAATEKGVLIPRLSMLQRNLISSPATGLLIYQTDNSPGFYFFNGTSWQAIAGNGISNAWSLSGNGGTNPTTHFIGTTDEKPVLFKLNNVKSGLIDSSSFNTGIGYRVLDSITSGNHNTALGYKSLNSDSSGVQNTSVGSNSLRLNKTGSYNTAVGYDALKQNTAGYNNTALGSTAGSVSLLSGNCTFIGALADQNFPNEYYHSTALGYNSRITGSYQARVGGTITSSIGGYVNWSNISDGRFKRNITEGVKGLDFILKLRPVTYNLDVPGLSTYLNEDVISYNDGQIVRRAISDKEKKSMAERSTVLQTGFVAQEVEEAARSLSYDFDGVDTPKNEHDLYALRYSTFVVPLVKAVQELNAKIIELEKLKRDNTSLEKAVAELKAENVIMKKEISEIISFLKK